MWASLVLVGVKEKPVVKNLEPNVLLEGVWLCSVLVPSLK